MRAREKGLRLNDVAAEHETTMMEREFPLIFSKPRIGGGSRTTAGDREGPNSPQAVGQLYMSTIGGEVAAI